MQFGGEVPTSVTTLLKFMVRSFQISFDVIERLKLPPERLHRRCQFLDVGAVLFLETGQFVQPLLSALEGTGIEFDILSEPLHQPERLLAGGLRGVQMFGELTQARGTFGTALGAFHETSEADGNRVVGLVQGILGVTNEFCPTLRIP